MTPLSCPACAGPMRAVELEAHYDRVVTVDHCAACRLLWFDSMETVAMTRDGLLALFRLIGDTEAAEGHVLPASMSCARCNRTLTATHDLTRHGRTVHHRCPAKHGHAVTHAQFLAEKGLLRKLSEQDLKRPKAELMAAACVNCGAPLDVLNGCACSHCGSPMMVLDIPRALTALEVHGAREPARTATTLPFLVTQQDAESPVDRLRKLLFDF